MNDAAKIARDGKRECGASVQLRGQRDVAAEVARHGAHMGQADALTRLVLGAGAAEQVEHAFVVLSGDAATVVLDLYDYAIIGRFAHADMDA